MTFLLNSATVEVLFGAAGDVLPEAPPPAEPAAPAAAPTFSIFARPRRRARPAPGNGAKRRAAGGPERRSRRT